MGGLVRSRGNASRGDWQDSRRSGGATEHGRAKKIRERFTGLAFEIVGSTPGELRTVIQTETPKYEEMVKQSGVRVD